MGGCWELGAFPRAGVEGVRKGDADEGAQSGPVGVWAPSWDHGWWRVGSVVACEGLGNSAVAPNVEKRSPKHRRKPRSSMFLHTRVYSRSTLLIGTQRVRPRITKMGRVGLLRRWWTKPSGR